MKNTEDRGEQLMELVITRGDISVLAADAIVNAAGTSLIMGSGVAGALRRRGGEELNREAVALGPVPLGGVAVTKAYGLPARYVIHAAAMPHYGDGMATEKSIRNAVRNSLRKADELQCETMTIPALGCGVAGFSLKKGAVIILKEITSFKPRFLKKVTFVLYLEDELQEALKAAQELGLKVHP